MVVPLHLLACCALTCCPPVLDSVCQNEDEDGFDDHSDDSFDNGNNNAIEFLSK